MLNWFLRNLHPFRLLEMGSSRWIAFTVISMLHDHLLINLDLIFWLFFFWLFSFFIFQWCLSVGHSKWVLFLMVQRMVETFVALPCSTRSYHLPIFNLVTLVFSLFAVQLKELTTIYSYSVSLLGSWIIGMQSLSK